MNSHPNILLSGIVAAILLGILGIVVVAIEGRADAAALIAAIVGGTVTLSAVLLNLRLTYQAANRADEAAVRAYQAAKVGQQVAEVQEGNAIKLDKIGQKVDQVKCAHEETVQKLEEVKAEVHKSNGH